MVVFLLININNKKEYQAVVFALKMGGGGGGGCRDHKLVHLKLIIQKCYILFP